MHVKDDAPVNNNPFFTDNATHAALARHFGIRDAMVDAGSPGDAADATDLMQGLTEAGLKVNQKLADLYKSYQNYQNSLTAAGPARGGWFWGKALLPEMAVSRPIINAQAQESDLAIITLGRQAGEGADRQEDGDFTLKDVERQLITDVCNAFHLANKPVVVVLNMGNVLETASWKSMPDAILLAWQPGQEGGYSVADVLTGKSYPSEKLTMNPQSGEYASPRHHGLLSPVVGTGVCRSGGRLHRQIRAGGLGRQCRCPHGLLFPHPLADVGDWRSRRRAGHHPAHLYHHRHDRDSRERMV